MADAAITDLGARVVGEGANLFTIEAKSAGDLLFCERVGGISSPRAPVVPAHAVTLDVDIPGFFIVVAHGLAQPPRPR